ncbi:MAG: histidine--tRNA ligase [Bacteroidales bacterium]|jgi:histidyl-tRNA synthetase|nr:histidine--tRNA ligase [Bacteroidales bacterium]
MSQKPSIPRGTRDFSPVEMLRRNYIFDTIRRTFSLYGYLPLETPAMENLTTLLGKYGEEGDKLLFRILNSGDFLSDIGQEELPAIAASELSSRISEKGLRYDLTVPFARYVVQHRDEITFPFRRYQIQPVWRADRPQKGRYREFFQCDVDVIGSDSLLNEFELIQIINRIFNELKIKVVIKINNRKILSGIAEVVGEKQRITDITVAIDKLDKIGRDGVRKELIDRGISAEAVARLEPVINLSGSTETKLNELEKVLSASETGMKGIAEMRELFGYISGDSFGSEIELDLTLARGLNYYTGAIIEVKSLDAAIGSVCGGGRYDDLTGIFGLPGVSGVGVSFGADRIYDVMLHLNLFPPQTGSATGVLVINFGREELPELLRITASLRNAGIPSEMYPDPVKLKKQFAYADACKIPLVIIAGSEEIKNRQATVKNMSSGAQTTISLSELPAYIKKWGNVAS